MMKWPEIILDTQSGHERAIAPYVISASRATDIPAFHGKWFMERLRCGYCQWINPFNSNQKSTISFQNCKIIVFWTKNPTPFLSRIDEIKSVGKEFYFQYTLNDYTRENLEPRIPPLTKRIDSFIKLSEKIGKERVIWRFDPIILGKSLSIDNIISKIKFIGDNISEHTCKLVFSFVDMYKKTENRLKKIDPSFMAPSHPEMKELAHRISLLNRSWNNRLELATCAEEIDLSEFGIKKNKCVDDDLILRICKGDAELQKLYGKKPREGEQFSLLQKYSEYENKDTGQRNPCGCVPSKDIGAYNTCMHLCEYCYANNSATAVANNMNKLRIDSPSLL